MYELVVKLFPTLPSSEDHTKGLLEACLSPLLNSIDFRI